MQMWRTKRALSESDCEDSSIYDSKDCSSPGEGVSESCSITASGSGGMTRKRRRGIIEKRRRDRINHSLSELRRLVPSAFEKQGSAKLEKAEILQLTVDHLKMLHAKGLDALAYDPHKFAMDYHTIGFRECAAEVARYLVSVEGMDVQDPLRLRLMSHLQCFAAQRELANKAQPSGGSNGWINNPPTYGTAGNNGPVHFNSCPPTATSTGHHHHQSGFEQSHHHINYGMAPVDNPVATTAGLQQVAASVPYPHVNHHPFHPSLAAQNTSYATGPTNPNQPGGSVKPYRPWGAELAY